MTMKVGFLTVEKVRQLILAKLDSKEWWAMVVTGDEVVSFGDFLQTIETTYYPDEANGDYEIMGSPIGLNFIFAKKTRMSAGQFAQLLSKYSGSKVTEAEMSDHDIIPLSRKNPLAVARYTHDWLFQGRQN